MPSIFDIADDFQAIESLLIESVGELTAELADALELNEANASAKLGSYYGLIEKQQSEIKYLTEKKADLDKKIKQRKNLIDRLKQNVLYFLQATGKSKIELSPDRKFSVRKSPMKVIIPNEVDLSIIHTTHPNLITCTTTYKADKTAIKNAIKSGEDLGWVFTETDNITLTLS